MAHKLNSLKGTLHWQGIIAARFVVVVIQINIRSQAVRTSHTAAWILAIDLQIERIASEIELLLEISYEQHRYTLIFYTLKFLQQAAGSTRSVGSIVGYGYPRESFKPAP